MQPQSPTPPAPSTAPTAPGQATITAEPGTATPTAILEGFRAQRSELRQQLSRLNEQREDVAQELRPSNRGRPVPEGADRAGLEARITDLDARIKETEQLLSAADLQVARAAAVPGAVVPDPPRPIIRRDGPPEEAFVLGGMLIFFVFFPLTIAYTRRLWKRGSMAVAALPRDLMERFTRLEQSVDSVALEVERIGEGQRFMTRVFSENTDARGIAAAAHALPIDRGAERAEPLPHRR